MELHEEIRRARKELGLSQDRLAELCGIQRRQLSVLERGGNVTINTLRKVISFLPNLEEFTFEQVRMKPTYIDYPPFEWTLFYANLHSFQKTLEDVGAAIKAWLENPPGKDVDPELLAKRTTNLATEMVKAYAHTIDPAGEVLKAEEAKLQREEERRQRAKEQRKRRQEEQEEQAKAAALDEFLAQEGLLDDEDDEAEDEGSPQA